jgi:DHA2 family multidrug resistance protein-like MFS transporter
MTFVALPFLLLEVWRGTATQAGLLMSCWSVGTIVSALLVGRWTGRCHGGALGALGLGCLTLGLVWLAWIAVSPSESGVLAWSLGLCGIGFGLFQTPNNHHIITSAPVHRSGAASGMLGSARLTGQTLGASLVALVFAAQGQASRQGLGLMLGLAALLSALAVLASLCKLRHPQALNPDGPPT